MRYMVSSCLLGENCKYSGGNNLHAKLIELLAGEEIISVCPEVLGGLPTPRPCAEIKAGRVLNTDGEDVTDAFVAGAKRAVQIAKQRDIDLVITQSRSPSCGKGKRYDGSFCGTLLEGNGVFVDFLIKEGIPVMDVEELVQGIKNSDDHC